MGSGTFCNGEGFLRFDESIILSQKRVTRRTLPSLLFDQTNIHYIYILVASNTLEVPH